jgi:trans-2-enoyl-CoA reductase
MPNKGKELKGKLKKDSKSYNDNFGKNFWENNIHWISIAIAVISIAGTLLFYTFKIVRVEQEFRVRIDRLEQDDKEIKNDVKQINQQVNENFIKIKVFEDRSLRSR